MNMSPFDAADYFRCRLALATPGCTGFASCARQAVLQRMQAASVRRLRGDRAALEMGISDTKLFVALGAISQFAKRYLSLDEDGKVRLINLRSMWRQIEADMDPGGELAGVERISKGLDDNTLELVRKLF